jgi:hypothetical protein
MLEDSSVRRGADTVPGAKVQRARGTLRAINQGRMPQPHGSDGERQFRRTMHEFVEQYHRERTHQGLDNELIDGDSSPGGASRIRRRQRLGGLLNYYYRAA